MAPNNRPEANEERGASGAALSIIGVILWAFDVLFLFFLPAAFKVGHHASFLAIMAVLAAVGLLLIMIGMRRRAAA